MNANAKAAPAADTPVKADMVTIKLAKPLKSHDGDITEITLTEPRAALLLRYGPPYKTIVIQGEGEGQKLEFEFIPHKMSLYLEAMTGIDSDTLGDMSARDMMKCFTVITGLLNEAGN